MLGFNQDEYLTSAREIIAARKQAETVADDIYDSGCSALFFASVGGSLAPMMAINEFAKELTSVPVYLEQAAELIHRGHKMSWFHAQYKFHKESQYCRHNLFHL